MFSPCQNGLGQRMKDSLEMAFKIYFLLVVRGCSWNTSGRPVVTLGLQVGNMFFSLLGLA